MQTGQTFRTAGFLTIPSLVDCSRGYMFDVIEFDRNFKCDLVEKRSIATSAAWEHRTRKNVSNMDGFNTRTHTHGGKSNRQRMGKRETIESRLRTRPTGKRQK